ncbi:MAG: isoprenylcysteine carboxylmethyltransferase family protein [Gammaproteobacteria bacterium]|nr:isoprenylcysteine carboxylmethyltransferase family protein [Gammaproteobacteria bacterium]
MIGRILTLGYGLVSYALFFAVFNYSILFIGNILVSPSLDTLGPVNLPKALAINLGLMALFAIQHTIMARPAFKRWWTTIIPPAVERSTFVLATSLILAAIVYYWQPMGGVIWHVENSTAVAGIYALFALGWAIVFLASFQINHFDLFGLRQVWLYFQGKPYTSLPFRKPFLYRCVRHPMMTGLIIGFWATPVMTVGHLVFALGCTLYIFMGVQFEENDLKKALPEYPGYSSSTPMLIPRFFA